VWAYRLLLDREPESEDVVRSYVASCRHARDLRDAIMSSEEFRTRSELDPAQTIESCVVLKEIAPSLRLFLDLSDVAIGLNVARGLYETRELAYARSAVRPGDVALDVGANIGFFTVHLADVVGPSGHVHAFEPFEQNVALLERSIAENRFGERVTVHRAAVGDRAGRTEMIALELAKGARNSGGAYLRPASGDVPREHVVLDVPIVALDAVELPARVAFVKIDVEGAEPLAFRGARRLLDRDRPKILSEVNAIQLPRVAGTSAADFVREMAAYGYRCHRLADGGLGPAIGHDVPADDVWSAVFEPA